MERQIEITNRQKVNFSQERGFSAGSPERDRQLGMWWQTFKLLALTPSEEGSNMRSILQTVRDIYSQEHFQRANVSVDELAEGGPLIVTVPEYNPENRIFTPRILAGHLDTVRGTERNPEIRDNMVYSNGPSIDNKSPVAAIITVTDAIVSRNIPHPQLRLVFTTDEETDGRQIAMIPVGQEKRAFSADKSGEIGTIVLGTGGYTGIRGNIQNLSEERMREFLVCFDRRLGQHIIARRNKTVGELPAILQGRDFSIRDIIIGPNNSRNTVASEGSLHVGIQHSDSENTEEVLCALQEWTSPLGATVSTFENSGTFDDFEIRFHGKAGHTSKVGTEEDDGMTTVLTDATTILVPFVDVSPDIPIQTNQQVRVNIGSMSVIRDHDMETMEFTGEVRYQDGDNARVVLDGMRSLIEDFGGSIESIEENRAYRLSHNTDSVREAAAVLQQYGYSINYFEGGFGISDANNAPVQWNTVVLSDGSTNPHRSDEAISLENVDGLLRIFYDLAAGIKGDI